ncbi:hypothetical protein OIU77_001720 [Salix suchowensis]|uniref:Uncharacterized protein n=1 Tax=Salix suchowensis TaxID=1278906 RepID=A0ABQ9B2C8_9ROSI|nr:hypothetical protein OIU77_001720 [Salix suchowensis]
MAEEGGGEELLELESSKSENVEVVKEGVASIALLPSGSISGHFIQLPHSICYGLHGSELACERECSRGEDYRLIKLTIVDFNSGKEQVVVVECKGHDAARFHNIDQAHGWEKDTLKTTSRSSCPKLAGLDAVVNIGRMSISGLDFEAEDAGVKQNMIQ